MIRSKSHYDLRRIYLRGFFLALIFLWCNSILIAASGSTLSLNGQWEFKRFGDTLWMPATVPGCVHTDLLANGKIPDPFYGTNEKEVQWIENEDWEYKTTFSVSKKFLKNDFIDIHFKSLDTYADVYLNDSLILSSDNMFMSHSCSVKSLLRKGDNYLYIHFYSPVHKGRALMQKNDIELPGGERVYTRKAQFQYGWDWGPRLVTSGIVDNVELTASDKLQIAHIEFNWRDTASDTAQLFFNILYKTTGRTDYSVELEEIHTGNILFRQSYEHALPTTTVFSVNYLIPSRWKPYELGEQSLYTFVLRVRSGKKIVEQREFTTGFSNIQLQQPAKGSGSEFYFTVNGEKIFIKGANLIPLNSFQPSVTRKQYLDLLTEAKNMHINMLRIWGGGVYEKDDFYNLCDSMGIMVWQDFMYACAMYPIAPENFNEIEYQSRRLKDHPCLALFCGNNEIAEGWNNWGWQKEFKYSQKDSASVFRTYKAFFDHDIPEILNYTSLVGQDYIPTSPSIGWGHPESLQQGDCHYWGVWWGLEPFSMYDKKIPRFMSEYGFQGMPPFNSFKKFIPEDQLYLGSPSVDNHQKHPTGYATINTYMQRDYKIPASMEDYDYVSQLLQARGMQTAIEAHRRNRPYCMGTLFWQLNDCWPVTSWSVIDYYGERKAAYYLVRQKYSPVMISVIVSGDSIQTWFVNDKTTVVHAKVYYRLFTTDGKLIDENTLPFNVPADTAILYSAIRTKYFLKGNNPSSSVLYIALKENDSTVAETYYTFTPLKDLALQPAWFEKDFDPATNTITITSNVFAKDVYLYTEGAELPLSDNFFDLLPGSPKQISLQEIAPEQLLSKLKIKCLNNLYNQ